MINDPTPGTTQAFAAPRPLQEQAPEMEGLLTPLRAAEYLGVKLSTIISYANQGTIEAEKVGDPYLYYFTQAALDEYKRTRKIGRPTKASAETEEGSDAADYCVLTDPSRPVDPPLPEKKSAIGCANGNLPAATQVVPAAPTYEEARVLEAQVMLAAPQRMLVGESAAAPQVVQQAVPDAPSYQDFEALAARIEQRAQALTCAQATEEATMRGLNDYLFGLEGTLGLPQISEQPRAWRVRRRTPAGVEELYVRLEDGAWSHEAWGV